MNPTKTIICLLVAGAAFSCKKEANRKALNAYFTYEVNGKAISINEGIVLNENLFSCKITGDTALQIMVSKVYNGAGFFIKDISGIKEGTYTLNDVNRAYYLNPSDIKKYNTTKNVTGSITLKKGTFQAKSLLNTLQGTFYFNAVDTLTGKTFAITKGEFLMERK